MWSKKMNHHYDNYLCKKYPTLYRLRHDPPAKSAMFWGFSVGDGWFNIINTLSAGLTRKYRQAEYDYNYIKDKLGVLRDSDIPESKYNPIVTAEMIQEKKQAMDDEYAISPVAVQVKEKFGGLRFYVRGPVTDDQMTMISFAEHLASNTCEVCGKRGRRRGGGWIRTLCNEHAKEK